jgi:hypothetical protein
VKTKTLFHTLKLHTGTWTIEVVHREATTHIYMPRHAAREALPADPWADSPIAHDQAGRALYASTMVMYR